MCWYPSERGLWCGETTVKTLAKQVNRQRNKQTGEIHVEVRYY